MKHPNLKHTVVWKKENELLTQANRRRRRLFKWGVIIVAICAAVLYLGVIAAVYEKSVSYTPGLLPLHTPQSEDRIPGDMRFTGNGSLPQGSDYRFMGLPPAPICHHTKSHRVWAECMGVGYRDTKVDRYLYLHREDD